VPAAFIRFIDKVLWMAVVVVKQNWQKTHVIGKKAENKSECFPCLMKSPLRRGANVKAVAVKRACSSYCAASKKGLQRIPELTPGWFPDGAAIRYNRFRDNGKLYRKDASMRQCDISSRTKTTGFTLIELLVVIVVIAILTTILVPVINKAIQRADNASSQAFVTEVATAAGKFKDDHNGKYPGQDDIGQLTGSSPVGPYTGSQILAARLFDYPDTQIKTTLNPTASSKYLTYESDRLISISSKNAPIPQNSLADASRTANALLYFPSRLNVTPPTPTECYKWNDNRVYVKFKTSAAQSEFEKNSSKDRRTGLARQAGGMLIIGTGGNDIYQEPDNNDDVTSWATE
jgi:prepilin-type N-terminal cleavage/methylation domain-containing protein